MKPSTFILKALCAIFLSAFLLHSSISAQPNVCHDQIIDALKNGDLKSPWLFKIASDDSFNQNYPAWASAPEAAAYASLSKFVAHVIEFPTTSDLRTLYPSLDAAQTNTVFAAVSNLPRNLPDSLIVAGCGAGCWKAVTDQVTNELSTIEALNDFIQNLSTFWTKVENIHVNTALASVLNNLAINNGDQVITMDNSLASEWKTGWGIGVSIFGILSFFAPEEAIWAKLLLWAASSTSHIGGGIIAGQASEFKIDLDINNALFSSAALLRDSLSTFYAQEAIQLQNNKNAISRNYGKILAASQCITTINGLVEESKLSSLTENLDTALVKMTDGLFLSVYQQLIPSKFVFDYQFKCNCIVKDGPMFCTDKMRSQTRPACTYNSIPNGMRKQFTISFDQQGWWMTWIATANESNISIGQSAINDMNARLPKNWTFQDIFFGRNAAAILPKKSSDKPAADILKVAMPNNLGSFSLRLRKQIDCENEYFVQERLPFTQPWQPACADCSYSNCIESCGKHCSSCISAGAKVTMADGSLQAIEKIEAGEQVMGIDGKTRKVLFVGKTIRNKRTLYRVKGLNFNFTGKHYFPTYRSNALAAVRVDKLRLYNATLAPHEMVSLLSGTHQLVQWEDGRTSPFHIDHIQQIEYNGEEEEYLYDLVLEGDGLSSYIVDGIGTYSEFFDLSTSPQTTMTVIYLIRQLKQNEFIMEYGKRPRNAENINRIARFLLYTQQATRSFLHSAATAPELQLAQDLKTKPVENPFAVLESIGGEEDWVIQTMMEALITYNGYEIIDAIERVEASDKQQTQMAFGKAFHDFIDQQWKNFLIQEGE